MTGETSTQTAPQTADTLITGIDWLVTIDDGRRVIRDGAIAIKDGKFAAVGKTADLKTQWQSDHVMPGRDRVVTPGFVDAHLHSSFQLSRGLADEASAKSFLFEHMYPYEGVLEREDVYASSSLAALELLRHGVTCYVEHGNYHPMATAEAVDATGMRAVVCRSTFDKTQSVMGLLPKAMIETTDAAVEATEDLLKTYGNTPGTRIRAGVSFRGLNNSTDELITRLTELARKYGTTIQTHAAFSESTKASSLEAHGMTEIARLEHLGALGRNFLAVHCGWLEPADMEIMAQRTPNIVAAPSSSVHNGYGTTTMGKLPELAEAGVNVAIGSDHATSGIVDMAQEMLLLAGGYKETRINPKIMPPEQVLEMATINGARAAGQAGEIGSIEVGKQADLVMFDTLRPEWQPLFNPVSNLVYSATGASVTTVYVEGIKVVDGGHLTLVDEDEIYTEVTRAMARLSEKLDMKKIIRLQWPVS